MTCITRPSRRGLLVLASLATLAVFAGAQRADDQPKKRIIGATAVLTEVSTGLPFAARIDTGAESCSLHVEKLEIKDESPRPIQNLGKSIRFLIKNEKDESKWIETTIARVVRIRSSVQKEGEFDRRYKVRLTLRWEDFRKEVLVTLNDRTEMAYPLLVGRNFLRGDFLVDVDKDNPD
jgi:hypothetical protein